MKKTSQQQLVWISEKQVVFKVVWFYHGVACLVNREETVTVMYLDF